MFFPFRTEKIIEQDKNDHLANILRRVSSGRSGATWLAYSKSFPANSYEIVHYDPPIDVLIMHLTSETDKYTKTTQMQRSRDLLACASAFMASIRSVQGITNYIDPDKPHTSFKDAMSRPDAQEWGFNGLMHIRRNIKVSRFGMRLQ